jgi:PEP-CTERM motif
MKRRLSFILTLLMAGSLSLNSVRAKADTVTLTLANPVQETDQTTGPGTVLSFVATVNASGTNTGDVFLNGDSFNVSGDLTVDDSDFLNFPLSLSPGQSFTDVLFTVDVPADAAAINYLGSFTLLGGPTGSDGDVLATAGFEIVATPEPSTLLMIGTGLTGFAATMRLRRLRRSDLHVLRPSRRS